MIYWLQKEGFISLLFFACRQAEKTIIVSASLLEKIFG